MVGMSGGVDSSVAAAQLLEDGYAVVGLTFRQLGAPGSDDVFEANICDARKVCDILGIEHIIADFTNEFREIIIEYFVQEYLKGRTPNPCTKCNPEVKWRLMLAEADRIGAGFTATGHYVRRSRNEETGRYFISRARDLNKDQSYMLWGLQQEQLRRTFFPLSDFVKAETRELARKYGLPVAERPESQEICFIPDNDYPRFLKEIMPEIEAKIGEGPVMFQHDVVGTHSGFPFYTIGQRKGLGVTYKEPLYVKEIIPGENLIKVGRNSELFHKGLIASNTNFMKYDRIEGRKEFIVKVRYKDEGEEAICEVTEDKKLLVDFSRERRAITPGQSVVLYEGDDLVGGAVIDSYFD